MKYYLLSGMNKQDDYNFYPEIAKIFKKELKQFHTIIYIPTYPEDKEKCKQLSRSEKFKNIGINFEKSLVLNHSYSKKEIRRIIDENELFFLYGGNPYSQIEFIKRYNITEMIKNKTIIGLSAGSINICKNAICTKDEEFEKSDIYKGMGLIDFSIEPHFDIKNTSVLDDLKNFSMNTDIYALEDDAYIIIEDNKINYYRKYIFNKKWKNKKTRVAFAYSCFVFYT